MLIIIAGIIIIAISYFVIRVNDNLYRYYSTLNTVGILVIVAGIAISVVKQVEAGQAGVQTLFGKVNDRVLESGLNYINPLAEVTMFDIKTQNYTMSGVHDEGDKGRSEERRVGKECRS